MKREGDTFIAYSGATGSAWTEFARLTLDLPDTVLFGLAVTALTVTTASLEQRARFYFDSNCSYCHCPGGVQAFLDARYDTPLTQQGIVYGSVGSDLGIPGARVVAPQNLSHSILYQRVNRVAANQMPPLARNQIDTVGVAVIEAWIQSLTPVAPPTVALVDPLDGANFPTPVLTAIVLESIGSSGLYGIRNQDAICRPTQSISALTVPT